MNFHHSRTKGRGLFGRHGAPETARRASTAAAEYYLKGRQQLRRSARQMTVYIEQRPVRSVLVALGLGCLVAALMIRR